MQTYLQNNDSDELIVILNGWGMDEKPFRLLKCDCNILFLSNYTNLDFSFDFSNYKKKILIAFSAGVLMSTNFKETFNGFDLKIAVNGTLMPFDTKHGTPENILFEMENISQETALDFRKKLIHNLNHLELFNKNQPDRDLKSSLDELSALKKYSAKFDFEFDKVIIGQNDEIIPFENQKRAWKGHKNTRIIKGGHFLFYKFDNFKEIIEL